MAAISRTASRSRPMGPPWPRLRPATRRRSACGMSATANCSRRFKCQKKMHVNATWPSRPTGSSWPLRQWMSRWSSSTSRPGSERDALSIDRVVDGPLAFSPDGKTFATTGDRQTLHFWDLPTGKDRLATPDAHQGDVMALACLPDGKTLVSGSRDRTARIWDLATGRPTRMLPHGGWVEFALGLRRRVPPRHGIVLSRAGDGPGVEALDRRTAPAWSVTDSKAGSSLFEGMTLERDSSSVIAALSDGSLRRWDVATGQERPVAQPKLEKLPRSTGRAGHGVDVDRAVFSRDGRSVALIGGGWVQLVDVASGERRFKAPVATLAQSLCIRAEWRQPGDCQGRPARGTSGRASGADPSPNEQGPLARLPRRATCAARSRFPIRM